VSFPFDFEKNGMVRAWHGRGMANVNQTRPHCVNQMGKTHSKTLAARHGMGTAWARHAMCESAFKLYWLREAPTRLTFKNSTPCPYCINVFCIYLRTNSDLCHLQHKLIGFYNQDEKCLQRGTD
jgi:hypothetical protein